MRVEQYLKEHGTPIFLKKGSSLFRQGEQAGKSFHYLHSGLLKASYLTAEGKESIKTFFCDGALVGSLHCVIEKAALPFSTIALRDSQLVRFSVDDLKDRAKVDLELANELIERLIQVALKKEKREREFLTLTPFERYCALRKQSPEILENVTQADIALYLGVTPVALSRMKSRAIRS
ncbi:Crp/Fnr family transcriptional regulator [Puniceicoccaceae bacterium K14]|nr:Crp/Fnr family transcriptional regulator [Puniceicoccaceae bacterium K14]